MWTGFMGFKIGSGINTVMNFGFRKRLGIFWLTERPPASVCYVLSTLRPLKWSPPLKCSDQHFVFVVCFPCSCCICPSHVIRDFVIAANQ